MNESLTPAGRPRKGRRQRKPLMHAAHDPRYLEFVARLRRARKHKGITQTQLAHLLGKPQPYVSKVETCERRIDLVETAEWCMRLGICIDEILPQSLTRALASNASSKSDQAGAS